MVNARNALNGVNKKARGNGKFKRGGRHGRGVNQRGSNNSGRGNRGRNGTRPKVLQDIDLRNKIQDAPIDINTRQSYVPRQSQPTYAANYRNPQQKI